MALTLKNGKIEFRVHYKDGQPIVLTTNKKYNNGQRTKIAIKKVYRGNKDTVKVDVEEEKNLEAMRAASKQQILKVKQTKFFFGGVPPDYFINYNTTKNILHTHTSLLGDIMNVNGYRTYSLYDNGQDKKHFGVELQGEPVSSLFFMSLSKFLTDLYIGILRFIFYYLGI